MTTKTLNGHEIIVVDEIPEGANEIKLWNLPPISHIEWCDDNGTVFSIDLPAGNYTLLGRVHEITEEQIKHFVDYETYSDLVDPGAGGGGWMQTKIYMDYENDDYSFGEDPLESFQSWCRREGITNNSLLIVKNN